jgi:hypothetical protein
MANIALYTVHSLRVTAAVALHQADVSLDDICFRPRWHSDAVKRYLRDCARLVDETTLAGPAEAYFDAS